jgi:transcriptional regulator with GAF, ATPase, and Fis domain
VSDFEIGYAEELAEAARALQAAETTQTTLDTICQLAVGLVPGAEHAAITVVRQGQFRTIATTSEIPGVIDEIQYSTGQGPCVDAIREHELFVTDDLVGEPRWPQFVRAVVSRTGVRSMLSVRLFLEGDTLGALNLYAWRTSAFPDEAQATAAMFAAHAAIAYRAAAEHDRAQNLELALRTGRRIGIAIGIIMSGRQRTEEQAFDALRQASQRSHRKVAEVAEDVIFTGALD